VKRRHSVPLRIGRITIGGDAPVVVQSMTSTDTRDIKSTSRQINELEECGCELIRVAVPDIEAAEAITGIKKQISIPIIADIHFDHKLALASMLAGVDGLRINPGNMTEVSGLKKIIMMAKERQVPIRTGVNAGSIPSYYQSDKPLHERMVNLAMEQIRLIESMDFNLIKVALKAFDVQTTIKAYKMIADLIPYPLHIGITEAGVLRAGTIRNSVGIGILLYMGIGDTVRVSLSAEPREEVLVAYEILKSLGLREKGAMLISCPSCGRAEIDVISLAKRVDEYLENISQPIKVAVMGCVVNGPGEAREADIGVAGGKGKGVIFKRGKVLKTVNESDLYSSLIEQIELLCNEP
jgi:(E)-4-hydroxy-3-methylbut-2-enyl-diphosphate synthase